MMALEGICRHRFLQLSSPQNRSESTAELGIFLTTLGTVESFCQAALFLSRRPAFSVRDKLHAIFILYMGYVTKHKELEISFSWILSMFL